MVIFHYPTPSMHIFGVELGERLSKQEFAYYVSKQNKIHQNKINAYSHWQDRQRSLFGTLLINWGLRLVVGNSIRTPSLYTSPLGKPMLIHQDGWFGDFNLSHSGNWIVLAIVSHGKVGIDIEQIVTLDEIIIQQCLSPNEYNHLKQRKRKDQLKAFYTYWTMKEATYKSGYYPSLSLNNMCLYSINLKQIKTYFIDSLHPVSVWWNYHPVPPEITIVSRDTLFADFV